ncbi:uncharacterized protein LTR77_000551 [Saxophila tyrrhenica]|uniref:Transcription factor domain-containing protein n=1 Tax=Saxophila tyrrhenica TaxID=1690608 RepID=A0AAV9PNM3_9PEZI|nr:hypothetical protein LTR77_000551 [Saxophila tyrrhenica]
MLAVLAQFNLARIVKSILRELYPLSPISADQQTVLTCQFSQELGNWRNSLAAFLDTGGVNASWLLPIVQRQRNVLNLTYWHAVILIHRPFLLNNLASKWQTNVIVDRHFQADEQQTVESAQQCLASAMATVNTINDMMQSRQISGVFWTTAYFAFTASIVLYMYAIQNPSPAQNACHEYTSAAALCQSHIASIAEKGSLAERYCLLLEELRLESVRQAQNVRTTTGETSETNGTIPGYPYNGNALRFNDHPTAANYNPQAFPGDSVAGPSTMLSNQVPEATDWGQFASLVSSGLGNLDMFLNEDPFML